MIKGQNVLIICDRGALDPSAYMEKVMWIKLLKEIGKDVFDLRDNRYNQVIFILFSLPFHKKILISPHQSQYLNNF